MAVNGNCILYLSELNKLLSYLNHEIKIKVFLKNLIQEQISKRFDQKIKQNYEGISTIYQRNR